METGQNKSTLNLNLSSKLQYVFQKASYEQDQNPIQQPKSPKKIHVQHHPELTSQSLVSSNSKNFQNSSQQQSEKKENCLTSLSSTICEHRFFYYFNIILLVIFLILSVGYGSVTDEEARTGFMILEEICQGLFFICFLIKVKGVEGQIGWKILDILTIIAAFVGMNLQEENISKYFKAIRILRLVFLLKTVQELKQEIKLFFKSFKKASYILVPACCIIYVYAIIGLYSFKDLQYNRCRHPNNVDKTANWTVYQDQIFLCGVRPCPKVNGIQYQCLNPIDYEVEPNPDQMLNIQQGYGLLNFQNIGYALFSTFKQTMVTGSSRLIILYKQVVNELFTLTYFYSFIYFIGLIYLNIFYGMIMVALEENLKQKSEKILQLEESPNYSVQLINTNVFEVQLEKEQAKSDNINVQNSQPEQPKPQMQKLRHSIVIFQEENESQPSKQEVEESEVQKEEIDEKQKNKNQCCIYFLNAVNIVVTILTCINLALDFEGQSKNFSFVVDCLDVTFYLCSLVILIISIKIELSVQDKIKNTTILECIIMGICLIGLIYEGVIATSFQQFLSAETNIAHIFRTFKYLRCLLIIFEMSLWKEGEMLILCIIKAVYKLRHIIVIWIIVVLILSMMGYHLHTGNTLVNEAGELDLKNGKPHQISFKDVYHATIFTTLTVYDEEWDFLMFQEYLGSGVIIVIWQLLAMVIGFIIFSRYLACLLARQFEIIMDEYEKQKQKQKNQSDTEQKSNKNISQNQQSLQNKVVPLSVDGRESAEPSSCQKCCFRFKGLAMKAMQTKLFLFVKFFFIMLVCCNTYLQAPNKKLDMSNQSFVTNSNVLSFLFFLSEMIIYICCFGLYKEENSYLRKSPLHVINILILIFEAIEILSIIDSPIFQRIIKVKLLRCLMIIQMRYSYNWEMRVMVRSLRQLSTKFFQLLLITTIIYFYFALIFTKLYKNDGYYCDNAYKAQKVTTKEDCFNWGGDWVSHQINFHNVFQSFAALLFIGTMEGWLYFMQNVMNYNGKDQVPQYNANEHIQIFFVVFFFFGNLIILNSFISLSLINFKKLKQKMTGQKYINEIQKTWLRLKLKILELNPLKKENPPENIIRNKFYRLCTHKGYKIVKVFLFILYLILISLYRTNLTKIFADSLQQAVQVFLIIMLLEYFIQLIAFGFKDNNRKQFIYQTLACIYVFIYLAILDFYQQQNKQNLIDISLGGLLIISQVLRYLKLLDEIPFAQKVIRTILSILPKTVNLLIIIGVTLYIYSSVGVELFCFLRHNSEIDSFNQNYESMGLAFFSLIKFSTLESPIDQITNAAQVMEPNFICFDITNYSEFQKYGQNGCGSPISSYIFFISFHIFYSLFLMSTLIALIVDTYGEVKKEENSLLTKDLLDKLTKEWAEIDQQAQGYVSYRQFWTFSAKFLHIINQKEETEKADLKNLYEQKTLFLKKLDLKVYQSPEGVLCFKFHDVIESLAKLYLSKKLNYEIKEKKIHRRFEETLKKEDQFILKKQFTSANVPTLIMLKSGLRLWKMKAAQSGAYLSFDEMFELKGPKKRKFKF